MSIADEEITEAVREYTCLYDKSKKGHCDRDLIKNCWNKVAEKCGLEDGAEAKRIFENVKKRFNKARNEATCVSGSGRKEAVSKKKKLEEFTYLLWLQPYIKLRGTKTNLVPLEPLGNSSEGDDNSSSDGSGIILPGKIVPPKVEADQSSSSYINNDNVHDELLSPQSIHSQKSKKRKISEGTPVSSSKFHKPSTSENTGREKWKKNDIDEAQLSFFKMAEKSLSETSNVAPEDPNDVFGKYIACELKQLGLREQRIAKHEMEGILFRIQMQSEVQKSIQPVPQSIPFASIQPAGQFQNQNYITSSSQNQQYPPIIPNQQFAAPLQPFSSYELPSSRHNAVSSHTFPRNCASASMQPSLPPVLAYSAPNPTESNLQYSTSNIPDDNNYSDETEY